MNTNEEKKEDIKTGAKIAPEKTCNVDAWFEKSQLEYEVPWVDEDWEEENYNWLFKNFIQEKTTGNKPHLKALIETARYEAGKIINILKKHPNGLLKAEIIELEDNNFPSSY